MSNNQIFSLKRMAALLKFDFASKRNSLLTGLLALGGILVAITVLCAVFNANSLRYYNSQDDLKTYNHIIAMTLLEWMTAGLFIIGCITASNSFKTMPDPKSALASLMLPASQFEKFLCRWIITVPGFILLYFLVAVFADWVRVAFTSIAYGVDVRPLDWCNILFHPSEAGLFKSASVMILSLFVFAQSFYFLGSIVWARHSLIKTTASLFVIYCIYLWAWFLVIDSYHTAGYYIESGPFGIDDKDLTVNLFICCTLAIAGFNYILSFIRLRESEIIKRW